MELDLSEERKKKLEAGKEKLAAFRKKKAKRKKAEPDKKYSAQDEVILPSNGGELSPPDVSSTSDIHSATDSDTFGLSGDEEASENPEHRSSVFYRAKLADARQRIAELEETVESKQLALDSLAREASNLKERSPTTSIESSDQHFAEEAQELEDDDLQAALVQRDALLSQLAEQVASKVDIIPEVEALAQQVTLLQGQLQETDQTLKDQQLLQEASTSALQGARNQMVQLQDIVHSKNSQLDQLSTQLQNKDQQLAKLCEREKELEQEVDAKVRMLADMENDSASTSQRLQDVENELEVLKEQNQRVHELEEKIKVMEDSQQEYTASLKLFESLKAEHESLVVSHTEVVAESQTVKGRLAEVELKHQALAAEKTSLLDQIGQLNAQIEVQGKERSQAEIMYTDLEERSTSEVASLRNKINEFQGQVTHLNSNLQKARLEFEEEKKKFDIAVTQVKQMEQDDTADRLREENKTHLIHIADLESQTSEHEALRSQFRGLEVELNSERDKLKNMEKQFQDQEFQNVLEMAENVSTEKKLRDELNYKKLELTSLQQTTADFEVQVKNLSENLGLEVEKQTEMVKCLREVEEEKKRLAASVDDLSLQKTLLDEKLKSEVESSVDVSQVGILEDELSHLKGLLDGMDSALHNQKQSARLEERKWKSQVDDLTEELESHLQKHKEKEKEMTSLQDSLASTFAQTNSLKEQSQAFEATINKLKGEKEALEKDLAERVTALQAMEEELAHVKSVNKALEKQEASANQLQVELQAQLESTVNQWQKLQTIVQEKEISLQNLQEDLEEQQRIRSVLQKNHQEELDVLNSELEDFAQKSKSGAVTVNQLESEIATLKEKLSIRDNEMAQVTQTGEQKNEDNLKLKEEIVVKEKEAEMVRLEKMKREEESKSAVEELDKLKAEFEDMSRRTAEANNIHQEENESLASNAKVLKKELESLKSLHVKKDCQLEEFGKNLNEKETQADQLQQETANAYSKISMQSQQLDRAQLESKRLEGQLSVYLEQIKEQNQALVEHALGAESQAEQLQDMKSSLFFKEAVVCELEESKNALQRVVNELTLEQLEINQTKCQMELEIVDLKESVAKQSEEMEALKTLVNDKEQKADEKCQQMQSLEASFSQMHQETEVLHSDVSNLQSHLDQKEQSQLMLTKELMAAQSAIVSGKEEVEMLKSNFDACLEDMQQKATEQEAEIYRLKSHSAEANKNVKEGQDQMKEIHEQEVVQLELRIATLEKEQLKAVQELKEKAMCDSVIYQRQIADLESSLQSANSEVSRMMDKHTRLERIHKSEMEDLKSTHEMQITELEDNCLVLEKNVSDLQDQCSDQVEKWKMEKECLEHELESQLTHQEEKMRLVKAEVTRLKKHLEEMRQDHERDLEQVEKSYESRLFELEDKHSVAASELERARKSMIVSEDDYGQEKIALEEKVTELENIRREMQRKIDALEDNVALRAEQAEKREEEMKSVLKSAAGAQEAMANEIELLKSDLDDACVAQESALDALRDEFNTKLADLESKNKHLESKAQSFERHAQIDFEMRKAEGSEEKEAELPETERQEFKKQVSALSQENINLKRLLLGQKSPEKHGRKPYGVEAICPPLNKSIEETMATKSLSPLLALAPSKTGFVSEDSFSPTPDQISLIEGFVLENTGKSFKTRGQSTAATDGRDRLDGEPDFVAEEDDRFQPEMIMEMDGNETEALQVDVHPIMEQAIFDSFKPEREDRFLMETVEEPQLRSLHLSAGMSPSVKPSKQFQYRNIPEDSSKKGILDCSQEVTGKDQTGSNSQDEKEKETDVCPASSVDVEQKLKGLKEDLEEKHIMEMRQLESELTFQFESKRENYQREMEQHFTQRVQAVRSEWELKFARALQKVRKELEKRHAKESRQLRQARPGPAPTVADEEQATAATGRDNEGMPYIAEGSEELGEVVEQLNKENQELAEARDVLLRQIEMSQAWGLHQRVQHELQAIISSRETPSFDSNAPTPTPGDSEASGVFDVASSEADSLRAEELSESSSSRDHFLDELDGVAQPSSQDLPLEWELTSTMTAGTGPEDVPGQESVWEVFDGRCLRQDCLELDALRVQYEGQLSSLQAQLQAERNTHHSNMEERRVLYQKTLSSLREKLDENQKQDLDSAIAQVTVLHTDEIQKFTEKNQHDTFLEQTALRVSLEQIYASKARLEQESFQQQLKALKDDQSNDGVVGASGDAETASPPSSTRLTDRYNQLIQTISQTLQEKVLPRFQVAEDGVDDDDTEHLLTLAASKDIRNLLLSQQEEIASLRGQLLGEYEAVLQSRADNMAEQTQQFSSLEEQLFELQQQYEAQLVNVQQGLKAREEEQEKAVAEERSRQEEEHENLKAHYEKRVSEMEAGFEAEISAIKEKYENLILARLDNPQWASSGQPVEKGGIGVNSNDRAEELGAQLALRDSEVNALRAELTYLQEKMAVLEQEVKDSTGRCIKLEGLVGEKEKTIQKLEQEKAESLKLYNDLLEKESPRKDDPVMKDTCSGSSVDDSFCSAKEDVQDTPRSIGSIDLSVSADLSELKPQPFREDGDDEDGQNDTIPFANDSQQCASNDRNLNRNNNFANNNNSNNNNDTKTRDEEASEQDLRDRLEELRAELEQAKEKEAELMSQIEDNEHHHQLLMENLRQELEHEKQVEVETLQSEFKIQMDIELTRQAAELHQNQPGTLLEISSISDQSANNNNTMTAPKGLSTEPNFVCEVNESLVQAENIPRHQAAFMSNSPPGDNLSDDSKVTSFTTPASSPPRLADHSATGAESAPPLTDVEKGVMALKAEFVLKEAQLSQTHQERVEELERLLADAESRYDRLMDGVQSGEHPELNQLMQDKYDQELELAKTLMQDEFDSNLASERKKFMEKHRQLMAKFSEDKEQEDEATAAQHKVELEKLRQQMTQESEEKIKILQIEADKLGHDLSLLADVSRDGEDEAPKSGRDTEEGGELTLKFQADSLCSEDSLQTSTPVLPAMAPSLRSQSEDEEGDGHQQPTVQVRSFAQVVKSPPPSWVHEKEDLEYKVAQLVAQVERLTRQLAENTPLSPPSPALPLSPERSIMPTFPQNVTLQAEDPALVAMLQSDLDRIGAERESVQRINDRLLSLLSDSVKTYVGVEDSINKKLTQVVSATPRVCGNVDGRSTPSSRPESAEHRHDFHDASSGGVGSRYGSPAPDRQSKGAIPDPDTSHDSHTLDNTSILSNATDEGLEISQRLAESIFVGPDLDDEGEEILSEARSRLQSAVSQLLEMMEQSTSQLVEAKRTQEDLLANLVARTREVDLAASRSSELDSQLATEIEAKEYLGLELHKAEGLIAGYTAEQESTDQRIHALEEQREAMIVELDSTRSRLEDFQRSQSELDSLREELRHQETLLRENAGQEMQALMAEVSSVNQDKRELSSQLQHQLDLSRKRLSELEALAEEADRRHESMLEEKNQEIEDLKLQLDNTERQLKASKSFVNEQMAEREQEREENQRMIEKLEQVIQGRTREENSQERLQREIADLTEQLQSHISSQGSMHQRIVDLQNSLEDRELNAKDLKVWVNQLEGELDQRGTTEEQLKERINRLEQQLKDSDRETMEREDGGGATQGRQSMGDDVMEMQDNLSISMATPRLSANMASLGEELERSRQTEEELVQENNSLKEQLQQQLLQMSALRNQIDQLRHYHTDDDSDAAQLRIRLQTERDEGERKEAEIADAEGRIELLQAMVKSKEAELEEIQQKVGKILALGDVHEENHALKKQLEDAQSKTSSQDRLPPQLLDEKNEEIAELKSKLQSAEEERKEKVEECSNRNEMVSALEQQVKEKHEMIGDLQDNLASIRRGEPCLDVSLPLTDEGGSLLNLSMTGRTSIQQELEETMAQKEGELRAVQDQLEVSRTELSQAEQQLLDKEGHVTKQEQELGTFKQKVAILEEEVTKKQTKVESCQQELQDLMAARDEQAKTLESLEDQVQQKNLDVYEMTLAQDELKTQLQEMAEMKEEVERQAEEREVLLAQALEDRDKKQEQLHETELKLDQLVLQVEGLQAEITSLTAFQTELQTDFDTVQSMLDEKEKEMETLTSELTDNKTHQDLLDTVVQLEHVVSSAQKELRERQNVVDEKEEELYELKEQIEAMGDVTKELESVKGELFQANQQLQQEEQQIHALEEQLSIEKGESKKLADEKLAVEKELKSSVEKSAEVEQCLKEVSENLQVRDKEVGEKTEKIALLEKALEDSGQYKEEQGQRLKDLEQQLCSQDANFLALQISSDPKLVDSLKQDLKEKERAVEEMQARLKHLEEEAASAESLKLLLDTQSKELEELAHLKMQCEETEEQLRFRQVALLDLQAEKDQLNESLTKAENMNQQLEEKEQIVSELEHQLKQRQTMLLDLEAERDRMAGSGLKEEKLMKELEEKENLLKELETKLSKLRSSIGQVVSHLDQEVSWTRHTKTESTADTSSNDDNDVDDLKERLSELCQEVTSLMGQQRETQERLHQTSDQLQEREDQAQHLQAEVISLQTEACFMQKTSQAPAVVEESIQQARVEVQETMVPSSAVLSNTIPGGTNLQERDMALASLESDLEHLRHQLEEKEAQVAILREELQALKALHAEAISAKDTEVADLQAEIFKMNSKADSPDSYSPFVSNTNRDVKALSPQTKQQISHLKAQLRKAHAALEQAHQMSGASDDTDGAPMKTPSEMEMEHLHKRLQEQEEELGFFRSQHDGGTMTKESRQQRQAKEMSDLDDQMELSQSQDNPRPVSNLTSLSSSSIDDDTVPQRIQTLLSRLNNLGEHILSVSDFQYLLSHISQGQRQNSLRSPVSSSPSSWSEERRRLMESNVALKELLKQAETIGLQSTEELCGDWRAELLQALVKVYDSERNVLEAEIYTANTQFPELDIVTQLDSRIHELTQVHQWGLDEIVRAERQSMLDEVDSLHRNLLEVKTNMEREKKELELRIRNLDEAKTNAEWRLQRQIQMLEYKVQQEGVIQDDLKKSLKLERQRVSELTSQTNQERSKNLEFQSELSTTQISLSKTRDALEREQHRFTSVTDALEEERAKTLHLSDILDTTKRKMQGLQDELSESDARQKEMSDSEGVFIQELQIELERERQKSSQFSEAEEKAQAEINRLSDKLETLQHQLLNIKDDYDSKVDGLQRECQERETDNQQVSQLAILLEVERSTHRQALEDEQSLSKQSKRDVEQLKSENLRLLHVYDLEKARADSLKTDRNHAISALASERSEGDNQGMTLRDAQLRMVQEEKADLQDKVRELEDELTQAQDRATDLEREILSSRSRVSRDESGDLNQSTNSDYHKDAVRSLLSASVVDEELKSRLSHCCSRLHSLATHLQVMTSQTSLIQGQAVSGTSVTDSNKEPLLTVLGELENLKAEIQSREEERAKTAVQNGDAVDGSHHSNKELLHHNQQLAQYILKLKKEKEEVSNNLKTLQSKMTDKAKASMPQYSSDLTSEEESVYDRTVWASERLSLQMALDSAEHEIQRLRSEIQQFTVSMNSESQSVQQDLSKTQRLYGKYLRAESFRKALVYQKKYLLLLLGGYRDTEQETLAILASMGAHPSPAVGLHRRRMHSRAFTQFRSTGRVVIAIFRMKYLVRKWKRATRVGSPVITGQISPQLAYIPAEATYAAPQRRQQDQIQQQPSSRQHYQTPSLQSGTTTNSNYIESLSNGGLSSLVSITEPGSSLRNLYYTTPPTKEATRASSSSSQDAKPSRARRQLLQDSSRPKPIPTMYSSTRINRHSVSDNNTKDDDNFLRYLENVQQQLGSKDHGSSRRAAWR